MPGRSPGRLAYPPRRVVGSRPLTPPDVGAALASRLDSIAFNADVALGLRKAPVERRRVADELVPAWLRTLARRVEAALGVESLLNV